jgi:aryl sulfotransferase
MSASHPEKRYAYDNHHFLDGSRWSVYKPRTDDIIVSTSMKSGTTWMMTILANMLYENGEYPAPVDELAPWLDMRLPPLDVVAAALEAQTKRRFLKTHLPLHGIPFFDECRYIVVGRDTRDVFMSLVNHHQSYTDELHAILAEYDEMLGRSFPQDLGDIHEMWRLWMTTSWFDNETDGYPYWSHLTHCQSWWDFKHLPNILFVHFNDLLSDTAGEIRRVADYLSIALDDDRVGDIVERVSFKRMKQDFAQINAKAPLVFHGGGDAFMHKGTNGRWREVLSDAELELYDQAVARVLTPDAARWLEHGGKINQP